jgi:hypothetical protein
MIKLKNIINELESYGPNYGKIKRKPGFSAGIIRPVPKEAFNDIKKFGKTQPILWRGQKIEKNKDFWGIFKRKKPFGGFAAGVDGPWIPIQILSELGIKNPVFTTTDMMRTTLYSFDPKVFVPIGNWKMYQSNIVYDMGLLAQEAHDWYKKKNNLTSIGMGEQQTAQKEWWEEKKEEIISSYKTYTTVPTSNGSNEIIIDCEKYWLFNPRMQMKNYEELMDVLVSHNRSEYGRGKFRYNGDYVISQVGFEDY